MVIHLLILILIYKDESYTNRWVQSTAKSDLGEFKLSHGKFYGDAKKDLGKLIN
jgi:hypothetical protein